MHVKKWYCFTNIRTRLLTSGASGHDPSSQRDFTGNKSKCTFTYEDQKQRMVKFGETGSKTVKELQSHTCEVGVVRGINEIVRKGLRHIFIQIQFLRWNNSVFFSTQIAHKPVHWYLSWRQCRVKKSVSVFFSWVAGIMSF